MSELDLAVGGRRYRLSVDPSQESRVRYLAEQVDSVVEKMRQAQGQDVDRDRLLVLSALMLADEMHSLRAHYDTERQNLLAFHNRVAERIEKLAQQQD